jgi:predicted O-methyltransferase YrrM
METMALDEYLKEHGFDLSPEHSKKNEGYMTHLQQSQFNRRLAELQHVKRVLEIGLNAGHSAENFFQMLPNLTRLVSFDLNIHPYTMSALKYLYKTYENRFTFKQGDSQIAIPEFIRCNEGTFDLIYIDGGHSFDCCFNDIMNCRRLAHKDTILWIDDYTDEVKKAVDECFYLGVLKRPTTTYCSKDSCGNRIWFECKYEI